MRDAARVLVFPAWRSNPYLNLLSLSPRAAGYRFEGTTDFDSLTRQIRSLAPGDVVHIHWTSPIAQTADTDAQARDRVKKLDHALARARRRGAHLVWTVHNRLPHELRHRDREIDLYRLLAKYSDAVHVMTPDTADILADVCTLAPERIHVLPHPSYQGIYGAEVSRHDARASFDLADDEYAVLFLGQIRPYKGVSSLIRAIERAHRPGFRLVLLLAGYTSPEAAEEITASLPPHVRTIRHLDFVPDHDLSRWFMAADVAVFPYLQILNSGSIHLAATFGVPVIVPGEDHLHAQFAGQRWVGFFDPAYPVNSIAELLGDPTSFRDVTPDDFARFTTNISPWQISVGYQRLLDSVTDVAQ